MFFRITAFLLAAATMLAIGEPAVAAPPDRYSVLNGAQPAGAGPEVLNLLIPGADGATVAGSLAGDRIEGFFAGGTREIVWLRFAGNVPSQVFVGSYSESGFARPGRQLGGRQREIRGTMFALGAAGGATRQRNTFAFRGWNTFVPQAIPPSRDGDPANAQTPHPSPQGAWWTTANTEHSAAVIEVAVDGAVSGFVLGDRIIGHYAADAGTLVFLRMRNNAPIQLFNASSVRRPGAGQTIEFDGALVALNPSGGASGSGLSFPFELTGASRFSSIASVFNRLCLEIAGASTNDQARLALGPCMNGGTNQHFSFVATHSGAAVIVARHSGKCLDVPGGTMVAGSFVQQFRCHGEPNQQAGLRSIVGGRCPRGAAFCQAIMLNFPMCLSVKTLPRPPEVGTNGNCRREIIENEWDSTAVP